jgi:FkbM family methyltransferase
LPHNLHRPAPVFLPPSVHYCFVGEAEVTELLAKIVLLLFPATKQSRILAGSGVDSAQDVHYVLCGANWALDLDSLQQAGVSDEKLSLLPVPADDSWTWWEFAKLAIEQMYATDGNPPEIHMSQPDFVNYVIGLGRAGLDVEGKVELLPNCYGVYAREHTEKHRDIVDEVLTNLGDDKSRQAYNRVLFGDPQLGWQDYISHTFQRTQYFDYIRFEHCHQVLNGGIWLGFEIPLLMAALPDDAILHNVDPMGYDYLTDYVKPTVDHFADRMIEHRVALGSQKGMVTFPVLPDGQASPQFGMSELDKGVDQDFPCITVDQFVAENGFARYGLIKFDLEAGEAEVIPKMLETINTYRPQMAISIYHYVNHMWEIPRALMAVCKDYNFYFVCYSWERWEGILYCIPREIDIPR